VDSDDPRSSRIGTSTGLRAGNYEEFGYLHAPHNLLLDIGVKDALL
jgi:hypothetical protein